jgi:hypothetical protein
MRRPRTWLAALLVGCSAAACREPPPASDVAPATRPAEAAGGGAAPIWPAAPHPSFENTPHDACRKFLYAWTVGDDRLLAEAIVPHDDYRVLFATGWRSPAARAAEVQRVLHDPIREFQPGDLFPVGLPGQPKEMRPVPAEGLGPQRRLFLLAERGMFAVLKDGRWLVDAEPIIRTFETSQRIRGPTTTQAESQG